MTQEIVCPECYGDKYIEYDYPVADYTHGGYIDTVMRLCEICEGRGVIDETQENDE